MLYKLHPNFSYCVDIQNIVLINRKEDMEIRMPYPQAAIFDLLLNGYSRQAMTRMMSHIALVTETHASDLIRDTLHDLLDNKVIEQTHG